MQSYAELDLPRLALEEPSLAKDPAPYFAAAREKHPWLAEWKLGPIVTSYDAIRDLIRMEDKMRTAYDVMVNIMNARGTPWGDFQEGHILAFNGPGHKRMREILAPAFTPRQANAHRPLMREVISKLLDEWAPKGKFDFEEFASYFPVTVTCNLIGASPDVVPSLKWAMETLGLSVSMDPQYMEGFQKAIVIMNDFVDRLVADREQGKRWRDTPDLLDVLLEAKKTGGMTNHQIRDLLVFLFAAGFDTSKNVLTLMMYELIQRPEIYARCAEDIDYCQKVVDETMRFHSPTSTNRLLTDDIVYRDVLLPKGTSLWFPWAIIGRDSTVVEDADEFRPERAQKHPHMGFALGAHLCLGQFIARAQLAEGLHLIAQRITKPKSPGPLGWRPFPGVWGIKGLPVEFEPAEAREKVPA